jgi:hypothetical protein
MLCEELGLAFCNLGGVGFERICDPHMQLPAGIARLPYAASRTSACLNT